MAQIAVIGMSSFGYYLAKALSEQGCEVLAIDQNEAAIDGIKAYVSKSVVADATDQRVMRELGLADMDSVVLSLGSKLESSILAAVHLRELGVNNIVAKAMTEDHAKILELLGVQRVIFPERDMGLRIAASLTGSNVVDYLPFDAELSIMGITPLEEMVGKTLAELDFRNKYGCQVLAIKVGGLNGYTIIPTPETKISDNHLLVIMGKNEELKKFNKQ